jgi:hypothetical protein
MCNISLYIRLCSAAQVYEIGATFKIFGDSSVSIAYIEYF